MALSNALPNSILKPGVCTSTTRPSNPYEGQFIYETDTDALLVYNGTSWVSPSGPTGSPTLNNQFANKSYVDTSVSDLQTSVSASISSLQTSIAARPTINGASNRIIKSSSAVVTTDVFGQATVSFAAAFPTSIDSVIVSSGDATVPTQFVSIVSKSVSSFVVRCFTQSIVSDGFGGFALDRADSQAVRVDYIAVGY